MWDQVDVRPDDSLKWGFQKNHLNKGTMTYFDDDEAVGIQHISASELC
jgi:hypothetical protein